VGLYDDICKMDRKKGAEALSLSLSFSIGLEVERGEGGLEVLRQDVFEHQNFKRMGTLSPTSTQVEGGSCCYLV